MAKQTSINVQPVKGGSEEHNKRKKKLDYVRKDLSHLNEYWECDTQANRLANIKA
ncbi:mobilization domain protein, partial [Phocaeicola vulgatus str. 3775 SR(B) 19]